MSNYMAFNYYQTRNLFPKGVERASQLQFTSVTVVEHYRDCVIADGWASMYIVKDGVIINELVKVTRDSVDQFLDGVPDAGKNAHAQVRPNEALKNGKAILEAFGIDCSSGEVRQRTSEGEYSPAVGF